VDVCRRQHMSQRSKTQTGHAAAAIAVHAILRGMSWQQQPAHARPCLPHTSMMRAAACSAACTCLLHVSGDARKGALLLGMAVDRD
jgi:hypothetical protein